MSEDVRRAQAIRRLKVKRDFWWHLATYVIINGFPGLHLVDRRRFLADLGDRALGPGTDLPRLVRLRQQANDRFRHPAGDEQARRRHILTASHRHASQPARRVPVREGATRDSKGIR